MPIRLFDLFPGLADAWSGKRFRFETGDFVVGPNALQTAASLAQLNHIVEVVDPRFGYEGAAGMEARLRVDNAASASQEPFLLALGCMPRVGFRLLNTDAMALPRLFVSAGDGRAEIVIEGLPVRIELPVGMVAPPKGENPLELFPATLTRGTFHAGLLDTQSITYRTDEPTTIDVHVRVSIDENQDVVVTPAVPINFEACTFLSGLAVRGVFDFHLLPSPVRAREWLPWIRHSVAEWFEGIVGEYQGAFAFRHAWLDAKAGWIGDASRWLNEHSDREPTAEFVVDDLVVPYMIPIPRHATVGVRRSLEDVADVAEVLAFDRAPVFVYFRRDPPAGFLVNELFLQSQAPETLLTDGLRVDLAFFFGSTPPEGSGAPPERPWSVGLSYVDEGTLLFTATRDPSRLGGTPGIDWKFGDTDISLVRARTGVSLGRLAEGRGFASSFVLVADILLTSKEEEEEAREEDDDEREGRRRFPVQLKGLSGKPLQVVLEDVGWWFGPSIAGAGFPGGAQLVFGGRFRITLEELGIAARANGGHYLVISAGMGVERGEFRVRGMHFKLGGSADAPAFGVDGLLGRIKTKQLSLEVGGYFEDRREGGLHIREFGFTGTLGVGLEPSQVVVAIDLLMGRVSGTQNFTYFMAQVYVAFVLPVGPLELRSLRALFADHLQPRLSPADRESRELRYYQWYRRTDPTVVTGDRRLDAWEPAEDAWGLGIGAGASMAGMGEVVNLRIFILGVNRPAGGGFLFAGEAFLLESASPIAYLILEWDGEERRFSFLLGVDITVDKFVDEVPSWMGDLLQLTGTLLISTNPTIVALGRIQDPLTWFRLKLEADLWFTKSFVEVGFCFEVQTDPEDHVGMAFTVRMVGAGVVGPGVMEFYVGWGVLSARFTTGSMAYASRLWAELGIKYRLFGFLNFGAHVGADVHIVGPDPAFAVFQLFLKISTPWFLPNVELRIERETGRLATGEIETAVAPLRSSSALVEASNQTAPLFVAPADLVAMSPTQPASGETARVAVLSLADIRAVSLPGRSARVQSFVDAALEPVATDASLQVAFVVPVNDRLGLGSATDARHQAAGELTLTYDLIGLEVHRRPRFVPDAPWIPLTQRTELDVALGSGGPTLTGSLDPMPFSAFWEDVAVGGDSVAQRLLLNATTPFTFVVEDPAADESLLDRNPDWPCCTRDRQPGGYGEHVLTFQPLPPGEPVPPTVTFPGASSVLRSLSPGVVGPASFAGGALPAGTRAGLYPVEGAGVLFRLHFDTGVAWADIRLGWLPAWTTATLVLLLLDEGGEVARSEIALSGTRQPTNVRLGGARPATACVAMVVEAGAGGARPDIRAAGLTVTTGAAMATTGRQVVVEVDRLAYTPRAAVVAGEVERWLCGTVGDRGFAGDGKIGLLPNHQYELALRTRISVAHPSAQAEQAELRQFVYFETKGLPGLNAVPRTGAEIEPYVTSRYPAERCLVYRDEPVVLAFTEQLNVVVPLADRPPGPASDERDVLMRLMLVVTPDVAETPGTPAGASAADWIVANRVAGGAVGARRGGSFAYEVAPASARGRVAWSEEPRRVRMAKLVQRPGGGCAVPDPQVAPAGLLVHEPFGAGAEEAPLWPALSRHTAAVVREGAPFVDRQPFGPGDDTAFAYRADGFGSGPVWTLDDDGALGVTPLGRGYALFGDADWDHLEVQVAVSVHGTAGGVVCAVPGGAGVVGWAALVERAGGQWQVALRRRTAPAAGWQLVERAVLPGVDAGRPTTLALTVFDDRLRAAVGETFVEAPRGALRQGRLALYADGAVRVSSLAVRGLTLYRFPVEVSRYVDFESHIASFSGELEEIAPGAMGGSASDTVAGLLGQTAGDIAELMTAGADPAERQALFGRWSSGLAIPFRQLVDRLSLSRYRPDGAVRALVLESPEPLRFTHEVTLAAERWFRQRRPPLPLEDLSLTLAGDDDLLLSLRFAEGARWRPYRFVRAEVHAGERRFRLYEGTFTPRGDTLRFRSESSALLPRGGRRVRSLEAALAGVASGTVVVLEADRDVVVERIDPARIVTVPVHFTVLADAVQQRALLIPAAAGGAATPLVVGNYRLTFSLDRERWQSLDPAPPEQRLTASEGLVFRL